MTLVSTERVFVTPDCDPMAGRVVWAPIKSLWLMGMTIIGVIGGAMTFSWDALAVFVVLTGATICAGHSVGMHRLLIHRSFSAPIWVEHTLVYLGTLVGMAGPFGMIKAHDMRDWMQRQADCHDHAAHRQGMLKDYWWQTHCVLDMDHSPVFEIEQKVRNDRFYRFLEATWMAQQIPVALVLFALGGWAWVVWGVCLRISISLTGHWLIGHLAHTRGPQTWVIDGLAVQGHDIAGAGLITFGEAWHNNHHAWPQSAKLGVLPGQTNPGWWIVSVLGWLGLPWDIKTPEHLEPREGLEVVGSMTQKGRPRHQPKPPRETRRA